MSSEKSLSRMFEEAQYQMLGKRVRKPVSYGEEKVEGEYSSPPLKRRKKKKNSSAKAKPKKRKPKVPVKKSGYSFCDSDDEDDGLLSEDELDLFSDSEDIILEDDSSDNGAHKSGNHSDDSDLLSDDSEIIIEDSTENTGPTIDKLLSVRTNDDDGTNEYLIKWKDTSYWHVSWLPKSELEEMVGGKTRIRHFQPSEFDEFDPKFAKVDRIIDCDDDGNYFCKWEGLGYDQSTWESEEEIRNHSEENKIEEYYERETLPPKKQLQPFKRPKPKEFDPDKIVIPTFKNGYNLHDYQEDGLKWLICCWYAQRSSILADEMGLGKTIQSVALLEYLCNIKGNRGPFIVVAPVSTLEQWRREIETWTNLNCVLYHGSSQSREIIRNLEWKFASGKKHKFLFKFNILVTSYQTILSDIQELSRIRWQYIIIDEGHRLKNNNSKLFIALQSFNVEHRLVLTGTPLQNNIQELWSILNYVDPVKFFELEDFERQYGNLNDSRHRKRLHKILSAYLLRRVKEDVFKSLPVKEETIIETELTTVQKQFYKAILNRNREFLCKGVKSSNVPSLINVMVELRKCCNHPFLINGAEEKIVGNLDQPVSQLLEALINSSAKLIILDKLLTKLRADGHQVLIFSQMTQLLNILEDYLIAKEYPYERLDGSVGLSSRQASIDRFSNKENDNFVFLLSTRAGGLGLNLTAANTVVIFDSDWNPQNDLQAQARCHRIGQTENVKIYRLVTKNTYESEMLNIASKKLGLEMVVLDTSNDDSTLSNGASKALDKDEIDHLLKSGAYELFNTSEEQDKDNEKKLFSEDINSILNRATTRKYDDESSSNKKPTLGNLSKVTYQIDIEDDFWESVLPEHKTSSGLLKQLKANKENEFLKQEVRDQFIQDIKDVIEDLQELLEARSKSFTFTNQSSVVTASKLIDAVINSDFFTSDEKLPLYSLQNSIINTKRERKTVDRTLPAENLVGMESNQTKKSKKEKKLSAAAAEAKKEAELKKETEWSKNLRDKVKTALTSLGPGRWEDITEFIFPNDSQKSKNVYQVRSLCESMIQQYFSRENIGSNELVTLKEDEQPIPKTQTTFYGKYIQSESNLICQKLESYYKSNKIRFTSNMKNDWSNVKIKIENESQFPTIDRVIVKKDTGTTRTVTLPLFEPGQKITLNFDNIPKAISESFIPVYVILRLIGDDKKEGNNCIIHEYSMENPVDSLDIIIPGYVGEYRIQIWAPLFTKTPDINTKKGPYVSLMVQCPEVLEPITRFAAQRWVTQCEFMKALEKLMNMQSPIRPTKLPIWWWNLIDDDDKNIIKGIYKYGYGRFSSIRSDSLFNYKDEDIKSKYETLWNSKSTQEKHNLGYSDENDSSKNDSSKKKLKDNPFEFPSTTTLNSHLKSFLKLNRLIEDTITSSTNSSSNNSPVIPKKSKISKTKVKKSPKSKTSVSTTKKNSTKKLNTNTTTKKKRKIVKKPILSSKQRDTSPENFVKKSKKSKKKHSSISSVSNVSSNSPKGSMPM